MRAPIASPVRPPTNPMRADSATNCRMIAPWLAPMALRMPISRVRSATDIVIVFTTDRPPTSSEISAMPKMIDVEDLHLLADLLLERAAGRPP